MNTQSIFFKLLFTFLVIGMFSCQDEIQQTFEVQSTFKSDNPIIPQEYSDIIKNNYTVNWSDTITGKQFKAKDARNSKKKSKYVEFPVHLEGYLTRDSKNESVSIVFTLLAEKKEKGLGDFNLIKFLPSNAEVDTTSLSYLDIGDFSGTVHKYDKDGKLINVEAYDEGVLLDKLFSDKSSRIEKSFKNAKIPSDCDDGGFHLIFVDRYTDWYQSTDGGYNWMYLGSDYHGRTTEYVYKCDDFGDPEVMHEHSPENVSGGSINKSESAHPDEIIKTFGFKNTIMECVFGVMNSNGILKEYVQRFDGEFPVAHLKFSVGNLADTRRAQTRSPVDYIIEIKFNNDASVSGYGQRPPLLNAKTIMHEVIHAEMFRKLLSMSNTNGSISWNKLNTMLTSNDFPGMLDYYRRYGAVGSSHQQMAQHYRETIAQALKEFDMNRNSWQLYMDLAWEGLDKQGVVAWDALSSAEQLRIRNVINNYRNNAPKGRCR